MRFEQAALAVVSDLDALGLKHALIGGFAVSIRTAPVSLKTLIWW